MNYQWNISGSSWKPCGEPDLSRRYACAVLRNECLPALADHLLVITTPEISSVRNIKSMLVTLKDLNFPQSKIRIVLNKADNRGDIKKNDVEATLNKKVDASIGFDYRRVLSSLNRGRLSMNILKTSFPKISIK
jgi:MinD-like ATPase involved in chromosome partitioning or flagellar assembly